MRVPLAARTGTVVAAVVLVLSAPSPAGAATDGPATDGPAPYGAATAATTPGADGVVAYVSRTGALETLDLRRPAAVPVRLVPGPAVATPRFNPVGKRLAFADRSSGAVLTVATSGGPASVVYQSGTGGAPGAEPTWSPPDGGGGQQLAFVRTPRSGADAGKGDLWAVRTDQGAAVGRARRITTDGAAECGVSSPDWSPDGTRVAYRLSSRNPAGTCRSADGALPARVVVRTLATGTTTVLRAYPAARGSAPTGPVRFTADGRSLLVGVSGDADGCTSSALAYDLTRRAYRTVARGSACAFGTDLDEVVPTPAGQLALATDDFTLDDQGGYATWCVTLTAADGGAARRCVDHGYQQPFRSLDVQPLQR